MQGVMGKRSGFWSGWVALEMLCKPQETENSEFYNIEAHNFSLLDKVSLGKLLFSHPSANSHVLETEPV